MSRRYLYILVVSMAVFATLYFVISGAKKDHEQYLSEQHMSMEAQVHGVVEEVVNVIREKRQLLYFLSYVEKDRLSALSKNPENDEVFSSLHNVLEKYINYYATFTIADSQGKIILSKVPKFVGKTCRKDLQSFSKANINHVHGDAIVDYNPYIHSSKALNHYDIMVPFTDNEENRRVFFASFEAKEFADIMAKYELKNTTLALMRSEDEDRLEATAQGTRGVINEQRELNLSQQEVESIVIKKSIPETRFKVVAMPLPLTLFDDAYDKIHQKTALTVAFIILLWLIIIYFINRLEKEQSLHIQKIQDLNESLEERVTERTRSFEIARDEAITAKQMAVRANKAKSKFLSRMSHELRTPLNAIIGFSQLIKYRSGVDDSSKKDVELIHDAGQHLLVLIDEVLDLSKVESGRLVVSMEALELKKVLEECYSLFHPMAKDKGISLSFNTNVNYVIKADHTRLKQALLNLLSNALKYNRDKGSIEVSYAVQDDDKLEIMVSDTGRGISEEHLGSLFEPFERLGEEFGEVEGTGIGLTITRQLIELMGGKIDVESVVGKGKYVPNYLEVM